MKKLCRMFDSEADTQRVVEVDDDNDGNIGVAAEYVQTFVHASMGSVTYVEIPADHELWRVVCLAPNLYMSDLCTAEEARREMAKSEKLATAIDAVVDVVDAFSKPKKRG